MNTLKKPFIKSFLTSFHHIGFLCLLLLVGIGVSFAYDLNLERQKGLDWVSARRNGTNWVAVNEASSTGFTYDNALAVIAYTLADDLTNARDILNALDSFQLPDGSWYDAIDQATGIAVDAARSSGNQAWVLYAICVYTDQTEDVTYLPLAENVASWLMARQDVDGGITGGIGSDGTERTWTSTEHNIDAYFAFKLLHHITNNTQYRDVKTGCKSWLLQVAWNPTEGRFHRGENDPIFALDVNTLGALFLNDIQDNAKQDQVMTHLEETYPVTTTRRRGNQIVNYTGFLHVVVDEYGPGRHWQEGTAQAAVSYLRDNQPTNGLFYINEVLKSDDPNFSIQPPHPDEDNDGDGGLQYYLTGDEETGLIEQPSPSLWLLFAINEYLGDWEKVFYPLGGSSSGGTGCFLAGTPILMKQGTFKRIEDVQVGDTVLAYDESTQTLQEDQVKKTFVHTVQEYLIVNGQLRVTPNHRVYSGGQWVEIGTLTIGHVLQEPGGKARVISSIQKVRETVDVYNLEVNPYHTYIADGVIVHNKKQEVQEVTGPWD